MLLLGIDDVPLKCGNCQPLLAPVLPSFKYEKPVNYMQSKIPEAQSPPWAGLVSVLLPGISSSVYGLGDFGHSYVN